MQNIAYYDGNIGSADELNVPFNDRSHFFGDGVYDATIGANGRALFIDEHLDRFYSGAQALGIVVPQSKDECRDLILELLAQVDGDTQFVYWQVTRGVAPRNHTYDAEMTGKLWVNIWQSNFTPTAEPLKAALFEDKRFQYGNIKTLNLLPAVLYSQQAKEAGADTAILHRDGIVTECAHSNVSILKDGVVYSHPNDDFILRGIGKTHLFQACYRLGISVIERAFDIEDLFDADEIMVTSSSEPCQQVREIDGIAVGGRDTKTIHAIRDEAIREICAYLDIPSLY